jgi:hypothetical protein
MKKYIVLLCLVAPAAFAAKKGNSDVGSSTSSVKCQATDGSAEYTAEVSIKSAAFNVVDYSGPAAVKVKGLSQDFMNVATNKSVYIKLENNGANPAFIVPLENKGDGQIILYFNDSTGDSARLVYRSAMDEKESVLAQLSCTKN